MCKCKTHELTLFWHGCYTLVCQAAKAGMLAEDEELIVHLLVCLVVHFVFCPLGRSCRKRKISWRRTIQIQGLEIAVVFGPAARKRLTRRPEHSRLCSKRKTRRFVEVWWMLDCGYLSCQEAADALAAFKRRQDEEAPALPSCSSCCPLALLCQKKQEEAKFLAELKAKQENASDFQLSGGFRKEAQFSKAFAWQDEAEALEASKAEENKEATGSSYRMGFLTRTLKINQ